MSAQDDHIAIMTTNHIEELDHALLCPGRVDMKVFLGPADQSGIQEHFLSIYLKPIDSLFIGN
jgi:chaperone BCS1